MPGRVLYGVLRYILVHRYLFWFFRNPLNLIMQQILVWDVLLSPDKLNKVIEKVAEVLKRHSEEYIFSLRLRTFIDIF